MVFCSDCKEIVYTEDTLKCSRCSKYVHFFCGGQTEKNFRNMLHKDKWKCKDCKAAHQSPPAAGNQSLLSETSGFQMTPTRTTMEHGPMQSYIEEKFNQLDEKMKTWMKEMKAEYEEIIKKKDKRIEELEDKMDEMENRSRNMNIEIRNFPETKGENVRAIVELLGRTIGIQDLKEDEIQVAHRVPSKQGSGPKPIVAQLRSRYTRNIWIARYKQLKKERNHKPLKASDVKVGLPDSPIYVHEHITVKRKLLLSDVKKFAKAHNIKFVWVADGGILVREKENSRVHRIATSRDFDNCRKSFSSSA